METKEKLFRTFAILLLVIVIGLFIYIIITLKQNISLINENPLTYSAKKYNLDMCSCGLERGATLFFNQEKAWVTHPGLKNEQSYFNISALERIIVNAS
jgi:hypothetical protein